MNTKRVMTCLAAGVCILAVSATVAFGSVNGYANYKTAVKTLALETDNVSASGTCSVTYDGETIMKGQVDIACDGADQSSHSVAITGNDRSESWDTTKNGTNTWFNSNDEYYYTAEAEKNKVGHGLLNIGDDELSKRLITLMEMGADTVMGDLKNNVIEIGAKDGIYTYQLDISKDQVPAVVRAALSVFAYAASDNVAHTWYVDYEDYNQAMLRYYEEKTGETLDQDLIDYYQGKITDDDWWEQNQDRIEKFDEISGEFQSYYYDELDKKMEAANTTSGVLYVAADGTTTFYPDAAAYEESHGETDIENFIGQDMTLDNVHFVFSVNKAGQLTANQLEAVFTTVDRQGSAHEMVLTADATLFDYGTTVVQPLDVGDRMSWDEYQAAHSIP